MPNRILREGILESDRMDKIGPMAELFYRRLMSVADDYGRYSCATRVLLSRCFPTRPTWADEEMVCLSVHECEQAGLLRIYKANDHLYLEIMDFKQQQRAKWSKYPSFEEGCVASAKQMSSICDLSPRDSSGDSPSSPSSTTKDFKEKKVEDFSKVWFEEFWAAYWRKVAKVEAEKCYRRCVKTLGRHEEVMLAITSQAPAMMARDPSVRPHASTWLNQQRWDDEIESPAVNGHKSQSERNADRAMEILLERHGEA